MFLYHAEDAGRGIDSAEALPGRSRGPHRINVLVFASRGLTCEARPFTGRIPRPVREHAEARPARPKAARAAIIRARRALSELTDELVDGRSGLVERVLDDVGAGQIEPALGGLGAVEGSRNGARIEAPYLQLVMQRLWEEERASRFGRAARRDA